VNVADSEELKGPDCDAGALGGVRAVLSGRLAEMYDLRQAALEWEDIEGVHRMRVASRRLRSALRDFDGLLGRKAIPQRRLKEVAGALGEVRDQDVAIAALEKVRKQAGGDAAEGIGQLIGERAAVRARARERLEAVIAETPLSELRLKFLASLEKVGGSGRRKKGDKGKGARRSGREVSFRQAGREVIESRVEELREFSNSLHHPLDIGPLHRMRIAAKRLRYALEMFAPCWGGRLSSCAREVAELQTSLGELRDCDLWIDDLGARLDRRREESEGDGGPDARVRLAAIWLLHHFTKERGRHFRRALARWHKWETDGFFERMSETLIGGHPARPEPHAGARESDVSGDHAPDAADAGGVAEESAPTP
jgi:CHAD domain-containing protein